MKGFRGRLLRVNLTRKETKVEEICDEDARKYLGGRGLGSKILYEELEPKIDPLGPDNKLLFMVGPLTGLRFPGHTRCCVMAKSPLTGLWGESHFSGNFGPQLKWSGFDGLIVEGASNDPIYIWVYNGGVEIRDAEHIWGRTTHETEGILREEVQQQEASVASIGMGGENLVKFACVISDLNRAAGRTGMGAVMGSKKLKAVAAYGSYKHVEVDDEEKLTDLKKKLVKKLLVHDQAINLKKYGTAAAVLPYNEMGVLAAKNFQLGSFKEAEAISGEIMAETILKTRQSCHACPLAHFRVVEVEEGPYAGDFKDGPEYETIGSLGSLCMNGNLPSIAMANHLCNLHSLDTISVGNVVAFAMECFEKGTISMEDTDGIELTWGNDAAIIQMIEKITRREGLGDLLAEGVLKAANGFGDDALECAIHVKGLEVPCSHDIRGSKGLGLSYATSNRGAVHMDGPHDPNFERDNVIPELGIVKKMDRFAVEGKAELTKKIQDLFSLLNSTIICRFIAWPPYRPTTLTDIVNLLCYVTGWDFTVEEIMKVGERGYNISRAFNIREGITRKDDTLPIRFAEPLPAGASANQTISNKDLKKMLNEYYNVRGWNNLGIPSEETLKKLGLDFIIKDLKTLCIL